MNIKKKKKKKKKKRTKNGKVSLPLKTCSACARVWSNCMQHSCSTSVHTSIQYVHVMRACIHMHPPKAPSPKKNSWHACLRTQTHLHPTKAFSFKNYYKKKNLHGEYAHKRLKKKKKKKKKKKNRSLQQKNTWPAFTCRHTSVRAHSPTTSQIPK